METPALEKRTCMVIVGGIERKEKREEVFDR